MSPQGRWCGTFVACGQKTVGRVVCQFFASYGKQALQVLRSFVFRLKQGHGWLVRGRGLGDYHSNRGAK
jgi:hypothetical protein